MKNKTTNDGRGGDKMNSLVGQCNHDYKNAERRGRCRHVCPKCKADITLELVLIADAGINVDEWFDSLLNGLAQPERRSKR